MGADGLFAEDNTPHEHTEMLRGIDDSADGTLPPREYKKGHYLHRQNAWVCLETTGGNTHIQMTQFVAQCVFDDL